MMRKKLILLYIVLLVACRGNVVDIPSTTVASQPGQMQLTVSNSCIDPIAKLAYPSMPRMDAIHWADVLPLPPWKEIAHLPSDLGIILSWGTDVELFRHQDGRDEIWISIRTTSTDEDVIGDPYGYLVHRIGQSQRKVVLPLESGKAIWMPEKIFLDKANVVWGVQDITEPLFVRYDDKNNRFEFVHDNQGLFDDPERRYKFLFVDRDGIFWLSSRDGLYTFDPATREAQHKIELSELVSDGVQMQDGSIYFQFAYKDEFLHYFPDTGRYERKKVFLLGIYDPAVPEAPEMPPGTVYLKDLFTDHADRLWFGDYGWLDVENTWYQLVRSPVFISEGTADHSRYAWNRPTILEESADGLLWFRFSMGLVSLDPQTAKWCWSTTYPSNIIKDRQQNLWILADEKLYKYQVKP